MAEAGVSVASLLSDGSVMDERRKFNIQVRMIVRHDFRSLFGPLISDKWGFYVDQHMSTKIHAFADWPRYPIGSRVFEGHYETIDCATISDDGYRLYTGGRDRRIFVWSLIKGTFICKWTAHLTKVTMLSYHNTVGLLLSLGMDNAVRLWDVKNGHRLYRIIYAHPRWIAVSAGFNASGNKVVSCSRDSKVRVWDVATGECIREINTLANTRHVRFIGDSDLIEGCLRSIRVWKNGETRESWIRSRSVTNVRVNGDESLLACLLRNDRQSGSGDGNNNVVIYEWPTMMEKRMIEEDKAVTIAEFHPLQSHILVLVSNVDGSIKIYDCNNGDLIRKIRGIFGKKNTVVSVSFSPAGHHLIAVSDAGHCHILNV